MISLIVIIINKLSDVSLQFTRAVVMLKLLDFSFTARLA
jgi:hypothetical protein